MHDLPLWFRIAVLSVLVVLLVGLFIVDANNPGFDASISELALIGVIGTAIGLDQLRKGGGGDR